MPAIIAIKLYKVLAYIPTNQKDEHGRKILDWVRVYGQINNSDFEFTTSEEEANEGEFNQKIPKCKAIHEADKHEHIVRIVETVDKHKKHQPVKIEIKIDDEFPRDLGDLTSLIDEISKAPKDVGRPILMNLHFARGVSALSRSSKNSNYRGIVTILVILLVASNIRIIFQQFREKGWEVGNAIYMTFQSSEGSFTLAKIVEFAYALHWFGTCPLISYITEKHIAIRSFIPRAFVFLIIILNLLYVLAFPVYYIQTTSLNPLASSFYLMFSCIWMLKFWSYHHIWHDVRYHVIKANKLNQMKDTDMSFHQIKTEKAHRGKISITKEKIGEQLDLPGNVVDEILKYPANVRLYDVWMFLYIPTLCFQLKYPYYKKGNLLGFFKRIIECFFFIVVWVTILGELCIPAVVNTVKSFKQEEYGEAFINYLHICVPSTYAFLVQFYLGFH